MKLINIKTFIAFLPLFGWFSIYCTGFGNGNNSIPPHEYSCLDSTDWLTDTPKIEILLSSASGIPNSDTLIGFNTSGDEFGHDIVVDSVNQWVYTVGVFEENSLFPGLVPSDMNSGGGNGSMDGYLAKLDYDGNVLWAVNMGGAGDDETAALTLAPNGNIYVTGYFTDAIRFKSVSTGFSSFNPNNQEDVFVAGYDPAGDLQFSAFGGGAGEDKGMGITANSSGVYVTGVYEKVATFGTLSTESTYNNVINGFIVKYAFLGPPQWLVEMKSDADDKQSPIELKEVAYDIASDEGNIYAVGYMGGDNMRFTDSSGILLSTPVLTDSFNTPNTFICSYDTAGGFNWGVNVDEPSPNKRGFGIAVDCDGVYVAANIHDEAVMPSGTVINTLVHDNPLLMKLDLITGIDQWVSVVGTNNNTHHVDLAHDVVADGFGNLYICGSYGASDLFNPDTALAAPQGLDGFLARYSTTGNFEWARSYNGNGDDAVYAIASAGPDYLFATGEYQDEISIPPDTIIGPNNLNVL